MCTAKARCSRNRGPSACDGRECSETTTDLCGLMESCINLSTASHAYKVHVGSLCPPNHHPNHHPTLGRAWAPPPTSKRAGAAACPARSLSNIVLRAQTCTLPGSGRGNSRVPPFKYE